MKTNVQLFARARDLVGHATVTLEIDDTATVAAAEQALLHQYPVLESAGLTLLWAVNEDYVSADTPISANDTVACFPPVSGG